jgi:hypothetical protein
MRLYGYCSARDPIDPDALTPPAHAAALERFKLCDEAMQEQRKRELEDLRFVDERGAQWPEDIRRARGGQEGGSGLPPVPARPCLEFNLLRGPVQQVINTARQAKLGLRLRPRARVAVSRPSRRRMTTSRAPFRDSRPTSRQWAFERAAKCGSGAYRILTSMRRTPDLRPEDHHADSQPGGGLPGPFAQEPIIDGVRVSHAGPPSPSSSASIRTRRSRPIPTVN